MTSGRGLAWWLAPTLALALACGGEGGEPAAPDASPAPADAVPSPPPPSGPLFTDVTREVGIDFQHDYGGTGRYYFPEVTGPGGALFDYDNDGDLDLYLVDGGRIDEDVSTPGRPSDRLYRNDLSVAPDGSRVLRFRDVTAESGVSVATGYGLGAAAADYDNDGWIDLYVTNFGSNQLLRNQGDGTFRDVTQQAGVDDDRWSTSASFLDYDRDGWLDLFVVSYVDYRITIHRDCTSVTGRVDYCGPMSYDPTPDRLFRNRGDGTFEDVTLASGVVQEYGSGLGVVSADYDNDGWIDVYVANDQLPNFLWINRRDGTFENRGLLSGTAVNMQGETESSMGVDAGDFDNDGDEDLFMTHLDGETNTLYLNIGNGIFEDRSNATQLAAASRPFTGFGTAMVDYDNDGWLDIIAVNGAVRIVEQLALDGDPHPFRQQNQLFRNRGDGTFSDWTERAGPAFAVLEVSRGAAVGDLDNDGDADVVIFNNKGPTRVLRNEVGADRSWLGLRLVGGEPPRDMLGAKVEVSLPDGSTRWRRVRSDASYLSANDPRVLIGAGTQEGVGRVRATWPDGRVEEWTDIPLGRYTTLVRGQGSAGTGG